ncbi:MAG TPA: hypothetical protein VNS60_04935 [Solirubrobacterales bacterium]|nr:hypothetical protein [Solirubrobacterales bacterium]
MRSESAYRKRVDETGWYSGHREAEARAGLIEAEARRVLAEAKRAEAEGRRLDAERVDIEWSVVRKIVFLFVALAISVLVFVHLLLDPTPPGSGAGVVALLLDWLAKRVSASD